MSAFVIVGGGQAGAWVAKTLRAEGYAGRIVLIAAEPHLPYERPPLSKAVLQGEAGPDAVTLLTASEARAQTIACHLGLSVVQLDPAAHTVTCDDGLVVPYTKLFICTGSRVRVLPGQDTAAPRLHSLRSLDDAQRLRGVIESGGHLLVLGGGWIGLEVAATARMRGLAVTVIEAAPRLCARSLPPVASAFLADLHGLHGVDIRLGTRLSTLDVGARSVQAQLADGEVVEADHVLIGIGVLPNTELAAAAGLALDDGIMVDSAGRTSDPDIYAAGDVTRHWNTACFGHIRLESWANAQNQAIAAARAALSLPARYDEIPWFWSDQYDVNIQIIGLPAAGVTFIPRGTPDAGQGSWLALKDDGRIAGGIAINAPRDLRALRQLWQSGRSADASLWASGAARFEKPEPAASVTR
jgi:3-phenylpropionate/trans-cinnamate dioxygenase ferredoxin reductase subunit